MTTWPGTRPAHFKFGAEVFQVQYNRYESPSTWAISSSPTASLPAPPSNDGTGDRAGELSPGLARGRIRAVGPSRIDGRQWTYSALHSG